MLTSKTSIQNALKEAQIWKQYEGVINIASSFSSKRHAIIVLTSCNPAAITAPIPSIFHGFPVTFCETSTYSPSLEY